MLILFSVLLAYSLYFITFLFPFFAPLILLIFRCFISRLNLLLFFTRNEEIRRMRSPRCVVAVVVVMAVVCVLTREHVRDPHLNFSNSPSIVTKPDVKVMPLEDIQTP